MNHIFDAAILDCNWMLDRERAGAEAVWRVGGGALKITRIFPSPPPPLSPIFALNAYSLGKYFLAPILHSYQIQDGGLIRKYTLARLKYACTAGYEIFGILKNLGVWEGVPVQFLRGIDREAGRSTSFPGYSLYFEKVPWLRLVTCLSMPTQAAPRVGPQLNFVNTTL